MIGNPSLGILIITTWCTSLHHSSTFEYSPPDIKKDVFTLTCPFISPPYEMTSWYRVTTAPEFTTQMCAYEKPIFINSSGKVFLHQKLVYQSTNLLPKSSHI